MAKSWTLGTFETCDVRVADPYVSGHHARVHRDDAGGVFVEDLGSTNGTFLQRAGWPRIHVRERQPMQPRDVLWLGSRTAIPWADLPQDRPPIRVTATVGRPKDRHPDD